MESITEPVANEIAPQNNEAQQSKVTRLVGRPGLRQFVKYCLVGASSFAIDTVISFTLFFGLHLSSNVANTVSFMGGVTNGFFWNSRWTFGHIETGNPKARYVKFLAVNLIGLGLNLLCFNTILMLLNGSTHHSVTSKPEYLTAKLGACAVVVFWNFFANKHWTFKA